MQSHGMLASSIVTAALIAALLALPRAGGAVSLMQRIRQTNYLTKFSQLLTEVGLDSQLDGTCADSGAQCFLVFAPTDEAFARSEAKVTALTGQKGGKLELMKQHIVTAVNKGKKMLLSSWPGLQQPAAVGLDVGLGRARIFSDNSSVLYWQAKEESGTWTYHANNARINVTLSNQEAANGILHVLDDVALPLGRYLSLTALINLPDDDPIIALMNVSRSLKTFKDWMARDSEGRPIYEALLGGAANVGVRTAFLPTNAAWDALPMAARQALDASAPAFRDVLTAHLAPDVSLFTGWLTPGQSVKFVAGHRDSRMRQAKFVRRGATSAFVDVGGVVAAIGAGSDLALRDAVGHSVDRVLAAPGYPNLTEAVGHLAPEFHKICRGVRACAELLERADAEAASGGRPWTLFAPADVSGLPAANGSEGAELERILMLHFVPSALIQKYDMSDSLIVPGANNSGQIRFRSGSDSSKLWVEGRLAGRGYVRSELLTWDEATRSGHLAHRIRTPLGRPALTLRQMVAQLPQLSAAARLIGAAAFQPALGGGGDGAGGGFFTAFVPGNRAMAGLERLLPLGTLGGGAPAAPANDSLGPPADDVMRDEVLRWLILPNVSVIAGDAVTGKSGATYRNAGTIGGENATTAVLIVSATDHVVWLQSGQLLANATASAGQYQCVNGLLYIVDSVTQGNIGEHLPGAQMFVGKNSVVKTTGSAALAVAAIFSGILLLLHTER